MCVPWVLLCLLVWCGRWEEGMGPLRSGLLQSCPRTGGLQAGSLQAADRSVILLTSAEVFLYSLGKRGGCTPSRCRDWQNCWVSEREPLVAQAAPRQPLPNWLGFLSAGAGFPSQDPWWGGSVRAAVCKGCKATAGSECARTRSLPVGSCIARCRARPLPCCPHCPP